MPTYGPNFPGTRADLGASWTTPNNIGANDASYATWSTADGGGGCFLYGTKIATPSGYKFIEDIVVGDIVLDSDLNPVSVVELHIGSTDKYYEIETIFGVTKVTEEHPFLFLGEYVPIKDIPVDSIVSDMILIRKELVYADRQIFNMSVDGSHTFIANGFKVHNK